MINHISSLKRGLVVLVLFYLLTSSSFQLNDYLRAKLDVIEQHIPTQGLSKHSAIIKLARKQQLVKAYRFTALLAKPHSSERLSWMLKAGLSDSWSAKYLGRYFFNQYLNQGLSATRATNDYLILGLAELQKLPINQQLKTSIKWLNHAYELGEWDIVPLLASAYIAKGKLDVTLAILLRYINDNFSKGDTRSLRYAIKLAFETSVSLGDKGAINELYQPLIEISQDDISALELLLKGYRYGVFSSGYHAEQSALTCSMPIQFIATNLASLRQAESLINQVNNSTYFPHYFCFARPRYIPVVDTKCHLDSDHPIMCDESIMLNSSHLKPILTTSTELPYLAIIFEQGIANVSDGILYLDQQDTLDEFKHELLHLLGFVDEFELPANHHFCFKPEGWASVNLYLTENDIAPRAPLPNQLSWQRASTCQPDKRKALNNRLNGKKGVNTAKESKQMKYAWRPATEATRLAHFELPLPDSYWQLLEYHGLRFKMKRVQR